MRRLRQLGIADLLDRHDAVLGLAVRGEEPADDRHAREVLAHLAHPVGGGRLDEHVEHELHPDTVLAIRTLEAVLGPHGDAHAPDEAFECVVPGIGLVQTETDAELPLRGPQPHAGEDVGAERRRVFHQRLLRRLVGPLLTFRRNHVVTSSCDPCERFRNIRGDSHPAESIAQATRHVKIALCTGLELSTELC